MSTRAWAARVRTLCARASDVVLRRGRDRRLNEEVRLHLDLLEDELVAQGVPRELARLEARRQFGGVDQMKMRHRDQRGFMIVDALTQDIRFALRLFARDRLTTASIIAALALGIGATVTVFTILNAMLLQDVPFFRDPDRVVIADTMDEHGRHAGGSLPDLEDWRQARSFAGMAAYAGSSTTLADGTRPADSLSGVYVTAGTFELLGAAPAIGRPLTPDDDRRGAPLVVLLSHGVWTDRFGARADIVGEAVRVNGTNASVIGVMPAGFTFPLNGHLWLPMSYLPGLDPTARAARSLAIVARIADGVTLTEARTELEARAAALAAQYPDTNRGVRPVVVPFVNRYMGYFTTPEPLLMLSAATLLLLLACANASSLLLSRSAARAREIALRAAMGASRRRIVAQLLVESLLLAAAAGTAGFAMASAAVKAFASTTGNLGLPAWTRFEMDATVFAFVAAVCLGTAVVFGCVPAVHLSRRATTTALKDGGRGIAGSARAGWAMRVLLAGQVALALVLLSAATTLVQRALVLYDADQRIQPASLLTGRLVLPASPYRSLEVRARLTSALAERIRALPGVTAASVATTLPLVGAPSAHAEMDGQPDGSAAGPAACVVGVDEGYFDTLSLPILAGRALRRAERDAAVVNDAFVRTLAGGQSPIGRHLRLTPEGGGEPGTPMTIVGVVPSIRQTPMGDPRPCVYVPLEGESGANLALMIRASGDPLALTPSVRAVLAGLDADVPMHTVNTMAQLSHTVRWASRTVSLVLSVFASIAFVLAMAGVYAVTAQGVAQRLQEIGVRLVLGAGWRDIAWLVARRAAPAVAVGLVLGTTAGSGVMRVLGTVAIGQHERGSSMVLVIATLVILTVAAACTPPLRRALRVDPGETLRAE